jgi:peroxiredoxin
MSHRVFAGRVLAGLLALLVASCDPPAPRLQSGDKARPFTAQRLDGSTVRLPEDLAGKVVVVRFWADWCAFCKQEMKDVEEVYRATKDRGLVVLAVNVGQSRDTAAAFTSKIGVSYDVLLDPDSTVAKQYGVVGLPTSFVLGRDGTLRGKILGESDKAVFARMVEGLL